MSWVYRWHETRKYVRRTGMCWRGGVLGYVRPIGPHTWFIHLLYENTKMNFMRQLKALPSPIFQAKLRTPMPAFSGGNTIQFCTYKLKEDS